MIRLVEENNRTDEYYAYLDAHIKGVQDAWTYQLKPALLSNEVVDVDIEKVDDLVRNHDRSKYSKEEFDAYLHYFYPTSDHTKNQEEFDNAWLHHIHLNPHHHQYWVLIRDEGTFIPLDMPIEYICEMLCDWQSFSRKDSSSTAPVWYENHHKEMNMTETTRNYVKVLMEFLRDPLEDSYDRA